MQSVIDRWQTDFRLKHCTVTTSSVNRNKTGRAMPKGKNEKPSCAKNLTDGIKLKCNKSEIDPMRLNQFRPNGEVDRLARQRLRGDSIKLG